MFHFHLTISAFAAATVTAVQNCLAFLAAGPVVLARATRYFLDVTANGDGLVDHDLAFVAHLVTFFRARVEVFRADLPIAFLFAAVFFVVRIKRVALVPTGVATAQLETARHTATSMWNILEILRHCHF